MADHVLHVPGMDCRHCARTVSALVRDVPGVRTVAVDVPSGTLVVSGDVAVCALQIALRDAGYQSRPVGEEVD